MQAKNSPKYHVFINNNWVLSRCFLCHSDRENVHHDITVEISRPALPYIVFFKKKPTKYMLVLIHYL